MRNVLLPLLLALAVPVAAHADAKILDVALDGTDGKTATLRERMAGKPFLLLTFFSASCPCQTLHDPRIRDLHERYGDRIEILSIDPEAHSSLARDRDEAKARGYRFPILSDPDGVVADAVGARFATYTVILDADGEVHYRGGWDTDRTRLSEDAKQWVRDAAVQLLEGKRPDTRETKAFGCYLRRR